MCHFMLGGRELCVYLFFHCSTCFPFFLRFISYDTPFLSFILSSLKSLSSLPLLLFHLLHPLLLFLLLPHLLLLLLRRLLLLLFSVLTTSSLSSFYHCSSLLSYPPLPNHTFMPLLNPNFTPYSLSLPPPPLPP